MKKLFLLGIAICMSTLSYTQGIDGGVAVIYGTDIEQFGVAVKGQYNGITEDIDGSLSLNFYFPDEVPGLKINVYSINIDGHYNFDVGAGEEVKVYGLAGFSIASVTVKIDIPGPFGGSSKATDSEIGINLGGGASKAFSEKLKGFGELKYTLGGFDQAEIALGVLFAF